MNMNIELIKSDDDIIHLFYSLQTREDVASILEVDIKSLIYILYRKSMENKYQEFKISKKDGSYRIIHAPIGSLKILQGKLNRILQLVYREKPSNNAHGFISGKSIVTNAKPHVNKRIIFNVDLKDFFPSINFGRVRGLFLKAFKMGEEAATTLAQICCYNNILPQGSPCSPIISNFICKKLDIKLYQLSKKNGCQYTRYADDITFSTNKAQFPETIVKFDENDIIQVGNLVKRIIESNGFEINNNKVNISNQYEHQEVTGLVVNKRINIRYVYIKNLRSMLHKSLNNGIYDAAIEYINNFASHVPLSIKNSVDDIEKIDTVERWYIRVLIGKILYLKMVRGSNDLLFIKYASMLNLICDELIFDVERYSDFNSWMKKRIVVMDPGVDDRGNGTGFYLKEIGLVTCQHVMKDFEDYFYAINPYTGSKKTLMSDKFISDFQLDVAIHSDMDTLNFFEIEECPDYSIGTRVKLAGYPQYKKGNDLDLRECLITSSTYYHGEKVYIIDGSIFHGASGGPVLNSSGKVIGIIRAGIESVIEEDDRTNMVRGFIPIDVISRLHSKLESE